MEGHQSIRYLIYERGWIRKDGDPDSLLADSWRNM
jgi:hypothetical protein